MKKNLFVISESERERILGMHQSASDRHYLSEAGPLEDTEIPVATTTTTTAAPTAPVTPTAPAAGTPPAASAPAAGAKGLNIVNDKDYEYKKDGETYSFRIRQTPTSANVLALKKQGKYADWTVATGKGLEAIKKLNFNDETADSVKMPIAAAPTKVTSTQTQLASAGTQTPATGTTVPAAGAGGAPPLQGVVDTTNMASRKDIRQGYRQEKRDVRELEKELRQTQNTLQRMANKMTPEQTKQYQTKVAQLQNQINQSAK
jgi:hypothetical protein